MKKITVFVIFMIAFGVVGFSAAIVPDDYYSHYFKIERERFSSYIVMKGECIWNISYKLLDDALMNTSVENIDDIKDQIVILNGFELVMDDGIVTFSRIDPDYIVPGQELIIPDLFPRKAKKEEAEKKEVNKRNKKIVLPETISRVQVKPVPVKLNQLESVQSVPKTYNVSAFSSTSYTGGLDELGLMSREVKALAADVQSLNRSWIGYAVSDPIILSLVSIILVLYLAVIMVGIRKGFFRISKRF